MGSLQRLVLVVLLNIALAIFASVAEAEVACSMAYTMIWMLSRLAPRSHGPACRTWTCVAFSAACGVPVSAAAACMGALMLQGLPSACL